VNQTVSSAIISRTAIINQQHTDIYYNVKRPYSYRNASIGSNLEAFCAG
jgi:hypothetical protein